jgi:hypothetical protein
MLGRPGPWHPTQGLLLEARCAVQQWLQGLTGATCARVTASGSPSCVWSTSTKPAQGQRSYRPNPGNGHMYGRGRGTRGIRSYLISTRTASPRTLTRPWPLLLHLSLTLSLAPLQMLMSPPDSGGREQAYEDFITGLKAWQGAMRSGGCPHMHMICHCLRFNHCHCSPPSFLRLFFQALFLGGTFFPGGFSPGALVAADGERHAALSGLRHPRGGSRETPCLVGGGASTRLLRTNLRLRRKAYFQLQRICRRQCHFGCGRALPQ